MSKINLYSLRPDEIESLVIEHNQASFRANQILEWLYKRNAKSIDEMTNLQKSFREYLANSYFITSLKVIEKLVSDDKTRKYILEAEDGVRFETVGIPGHDNSVPDYIIESNQKLNECADDHKTTKNFKTLTVCISTQAGCKMGCKFCATGKQHFYRNLSVGEVVQQVLYVQNDFDTRVTNVVIMGQGEPFLNYKNVIAALRVLNDSKLIGIGARKITLSTCGIIKGIDKFSEEPFQFGLAVSLHCANQKLRDLLMPGVKNQDLKNLKAVLLNYQTKTNRRITLEHILIKDVNDSENCLNELIEFCKGLLCHVNLLSYNRVNDVDYKSCSLKEIKFWEKSLINAGINATYRVSRGSDIAGACGQLINDNK